MKASTTCVLCALLSLLAACGGGDGSGDGTVAATNTATDASAGPSAAAGTGVSPGPSSAACAGAGTTPLGEANKLVSGVFGGTLKDDVNFDLLYVVMGDGRKVGYFGTDTSSSFDVAGTWISTDSVSYYRAPNETEFRAINGYFRDGIAYVIVTFDMAIPCMSGLITVERSTTRTATFVGGPIQNSSYVYRAPASVMSVAGLWELNGGTGNHWTLDIAANGGVKGTYAGCSFTGAVKPSYSGENALTLRFDFDDPEIRCNPALENSRDYIGFAIALPLTTGHTRLLVFVQSAAGWNSITFTGLGQR